MIASALVAWVMILPSCTKEPVNDPYGDLPPYNPTPLSIQLPANMPVMEIPAYNPTTVEGVALGRRLYYEPLLHSSGNKSCSSCHVQSAGFTTQGTNVVPHLNLGYSDKFLWDGAEQGTLEDVMVFEVDDFFHADMNRLQKHNEYPMLYYQAFGSPEITVQKTAYALAQFLRTVISADSKFDRFLRHELSLTMEENQGFNIFNTERGDCFHCHTLSLMTDGDLHNIGLDSVFVGEDAGYYNVSGNPADLGKFKSPSLRNAGIRTSFMHDGRFTTLDEVIEHYNSGVKSAPSLDPIMTKPGKENGLELTPMEKQQLKAFLLTLTDSVYLNNPDYSSPF